MRSRSFVEQERKEKRARRQEDDIEADEQLQIAAALGEGAAVERKH